MRFSFIRVRALEVVICVEYSALTAYICEPLAPFSSAIPTEPSGPSAAIYREAKFSSASS